jgi:hypothetical protein
VTKKTEAVSEVEKYREENIKYEEFHGKVDSTYISEFSKPLIELGFSHDNIVTLLINKMTIDLSVELKQADIEIERYKSNNGVCDCPECKKARGEDEDTGL